MADGWRGRLGGQVRVRLEGGSPERLLNLCGELGIRFSRPAWESPEVFTFRVSRRDWRLLRRELDAAGLDAPAVELHGLPALARRMRSRPALAVTLVVLATALFLGSFFVWDYDISGNATVPDETILRALEKYGVGPGAFGLALDGEDIRNHVLLDIPELCWVAVNVSGCRAKVQVRERVPAPELLDERMPTNVVARRAGLVRDIRALDGAAQVLPGSSVTEGQLLISGTENVETWGTVRVMAGHGFVTARTWYRLTAALPLTGTEKRYTGEEARCFSLVLGRRRIKFFSNRRLEGLEPGRNYDKMTERFRCAVLGIPLPVTVERETVRYYETALAVRTAAEVQKRGEAALLSQLRELSAPYGEIRSTLCASHQAGDTLEVTLTAECLEEIGVSVPIYADAAPEP